MSEARWFHDVDIPLRSRLGLSGPVPLSCPPRDSCRSLLSRVPTLGVLVPILSRKKDSFVPCGPLLALVRREMKSTHIGEQPARRNE